MQYDIYLTCSHWWSPFSRPQFHRNICLNAWIIYISIPFSSFKPNIICCYHGWLWIRKTWDKRSYLLEVTTRKSCPTRDKNTWIIYAVEWFNYSRRELSLVQSENNRGTFGELSQYYNVGNQKKNVMSKISRKMRSFFCILK